MYKELTFETNNSKGVFLYSIGEGRDHGYLTKTASMNFHPEIQKYIDSAKKIEGKTQALLTALGAGEYYGSNVNGDFFPRESLRHYGKDYGHKTFEYYAKVYKHHVNKDPNKSYGDVILAVWNEHMKRVELIVTIDHDKAPDLIERIDNGENLEVSMGCKVPFDVCSCCGNKAKTRAQYCDHLRYHMNKIPPGYTKKAYAINLRPKFFDISFVLIGADRIAKVLKKVAHVAGAEVVSSAEMGEKTYSELGKRDFEKRAFGLSYQKVAARKLAEIEKQVDSNISPNTVKNIEDIGEQGKDVLRAYEKDIPKRVIIKITTSDTPGPGLLNKILSTLVMSGVSPKPREFQSIVLRSLGKHDLAEDFDRKNIVFDPCCRVKKEKVDTFFNMLDLGSDHFNNGIFSEIHPYLENRSYARPILGRRIVKLIKLAELGALPPPTVEKVASEEERKPFGILPVMAALTGLYLAFGKKSTKAMTQVESFIHKHPLLATALGASMIGATKGVDALGNRKIMGKYDFNPDKGATPHMSWQDRIRAQNAEPLVKSAKISLPVKLLAGVPALYMLSGMQEVKRARNPYEQESLIGSTLRKYPDLLSAALVGSHFVKTPKMGNLLNKIKTKFGATKLASSEKNAIDPFTKTSEIGEDIKSNALFTLAFPGKSMALRGASLMTDMALMSGIGKLYAHMNKKSGGKYNDNYK